MATGILRFRNLRERLFCLSPCATLMKTTALRKNLLQRRSGAALDYVMVMIAARHAREAAASFGSTNTKLIGLLTTLYRPTHWLSTPPRLMRHSSVVKS